jgi:hypothetical protein
MKDFSNLSGGRSSKSKIAKLPEKSDIKYEETGSGCGIERGYTNEGGGTGNSEEAFPIF